MAKEAQHYADAERMFIIEHCTLESISLSTGVSTRTLQEWKKKGDWATRRHEHAQTNTTLDERLLRMINTIVNKATEDVEEGKELSAAQLYAIHKFIQVLQKARDYDKERIAANAEAANESTTPAEVTQEDIVNAVRVALGIKPA